MYSLHCYLVPCPEITKLPVNITVLPGEASQFSCMAFSFADLKYEWKRSGFANLLTGATKSLKLDKQTAMVYSILNISKTNVSHEGWYCCVVTNECGDVKECSWLEVNSELLSV